MNKTELIETENKKIKLVKFIADLTCNRLYQENLTLNQALDLINDTKSLILNIFPDKEETYNMIYKRRFFRIVRERFS